VKYIRHSPSALNTFCAEPAMFVLERILGIKQPTNAPMFLGTAVEDGVTHGLNNLTAAIDDCCDVAFKKYDRETALTSDARRAEYREMIPAMVTNALDELRGYGTPSGCQGSVEWKPEGLIYPIFGYWDYRWEDQGILIDLKTTQKQPSSIKISHARQVALYAIAAGDNTDARITYVTPKKKITYQLENVRDHLNALHRIALTVERWLAMSDDPQFFIDRTVPDIESFYWGGPARELAFKYWKI
jgi:hypothetical protein